MGPNVLLSGIGFMGLGRVVAVCMEKYKACYNGTALYNFALPNNYDSQQDKNSDDTECEEPDDGFILQFWSLPYS